MKITRKLLLILLILSLAIGLFACGGGGKCKEHADGDGDGKCDNCGETVEKEEARVLLFDDGIPNFQFVLATGLSKASRTLIDDYIDAMEEFDITIDTVSDKADGEIECEILIGSVTSRGDKYIYDTHELGNDGYIFKIIDKKIIVNAGSPDALEAAIEEFIYDVLMFDEDAEEIGTIYMAEAQEILEKQEYDITSIKVNGNDIKGYTIATDTSALGAAQKLQNVIYDRAGYWLEIVALNKADKSIIINAAEPVYDENSFKVYTNAKNQLIIDCSFANKLEDAVSEFLSNKIITAKGDVNLEGDSIYKQDISFLTYEEFGAKGDGKTDDFVAIYNTHVEANKYKQTVIANNSAHYYIEESRIPKLDGTKQAVSIPICTNVKWGKAKFTIDDTRISGMPGSTTKDMLGLNIFSIQSDYGSTSIKDRPILDRVLAGGLNPQSTRVDLSFDYPVMIIPYNDSHTVYRRLGYGSALGASMHEVIVLDKNGNIDPSTPVMFDYTDLSYITVIRLDIEPITIDGGIFTTKASRTNAIYTNSNNKKDVQGSYIARGMGCSRSFTTIKNVEHYITGEVAIADQLQGGERVHVSHCYSAFYSPSNANEITYYNCKLTGRRAYTRPSDSVTTGTGGTYDLGGNAVNKLRFEKCTQTNFWVTVDPDTAVITPVADRDVPDVKTSMESYSYNGSSTIMFWGIGGTNYCKNMEYIDSLLSRFDAHCGLYNGKIIGTTINGMELTGNGELIIEDTVWYANGTGAGGNAMFHLRADYGATWTGDIKAKDFKAYVHTNHPTYVFFHTYNNWYYGYTSHLPNVVLDNLQIFDVRTYQPAEEGYTVRLMQDTIWTEPGMHLKTCLNTAARYCYVDLDKDGLIDGTDWEFKQNEQSLYEGGINKYTSSDPLRFKNLNRIVPPAYIKVINNNGRYQFIIPDTYGDAPSVDTDMTLPDGAEANGGFFGTTKFYYGTGENDFYLGTNHTGNETFDFQRN